MRKPRDFDTELKALEDKARKLKERKVQQLGELVIATGADALTFEELAGALVAIADTKDAGRKEAWAKRGQTFFQRETMRSQRAATTNATSDSAPDGAAQSASNSHGAA
jgi:hypothetical protein